MKDFNQIIDQSISESGGNEGKFYAYIINHLLESAKVFQLLTQANELSHLTAKIIDAPSASRSIFRRNNRATLKSKLDLLLKDSMRVLGCNQDEHSLFAAALTGLADKEKRIDAQKIVAELIEKNLHRLTTITPPPYFVGRKEEQSRIQRIIGRSERNDVLIVGDAGVGKTTLAKKILHDSGRLVYAPSISSTQMIQELLAITEGKQVQPIVFLDEIASYDVQAIQKIIPVTTVVATSNHTAYQRITQQHPELLTTFELVHLEEHPKEEVEAIIAKRLKLLSTHHHIDHDPEAIKTTFALTSQYIDNPSYPAKALMLLEEAYLYVREHHEPTLTSDHLKVIVAQKTNIPLAKLTDVERQDLSTLPAKLKQRVKGQPQAVEAVARSLQRSRLGFGDRSKPMGSFLFVGPSGVGKTELAKALAEAMFGKEDQLVRIDMSEYTQDHTVQRLIGAPPGYVGFEAGGQLTNPIKKQPYSLVLLDEIEKAHPRVFDIFLQVLDDGRLTDGKGVTVDFRHTIVIATSNAGIEDIVDLYETNSSKQKIKAEIKEILQDYFRIEFLNRFDHIVLFHALDKKALTQIAKKQLDKLAVELKLRNISINYSQELINKLVQESLDPRYGARGLLRLIQDKVENVLAKQIVSGKLQAGDTISF